jgi:hypothetical protein
VEVDRLTDQAEIMVTGVVADIEVVADEPTVARVLIGDDEAEWYFPMSLLPEGVQVSDDLLFAAEDGRFSAVGFARVSGHSTERSIEERLSRPLSRRRAGSQEPGVPSTTGR